MEIKLWWSDKIKAIPQHTVFVPFAQKMAKRLIVGFERYGPPQRRQKYMGRLEAEWKKYKRTGNAEHLYNVANYCILECAAPQHPKHHFDEHAKSATRDKFGV